MPLDQAVYHSPTDKIYGIRGGWVHVFNATTGALENSYWTLPCGGSNSSIVSCGSYLYASSWNAQIRNFSNLAMWQNTGLYMDVYRIDPTNLSAAPVCLNVIPAIQNGNYWQNPCGFLGLTTNGTRIGGLVGWVAAGCYACTFNPASIPNPAFDPPLPSTLLHSTGDHLGDMAYIQSGSLVMVACSPTFYEVSAYTDNAVTGPNQDYEESIAAAPTLNAFGVTYALSTNKIYYCTGSRYLLRYDADCTNETYVDIGIAAARPKRLKYWSVNDRVYIPNWSADSVTILNPNTDAVVSTESGFDKPIDIVFTPTKAFAVQDAATGLRAIA